MYQIHFQGYRNITWYFERCGHFDWDQRCEELFSWRRLEKLAEDKGETVPSSASGPLKPDVFTKTGQWITTSRPHSRDPQSTTKLLDLMHSTSPSFLFPVLYSLQCLCGSPDTFPLSLLYSYGKCSIPQFLLQKESIKCFIRGMTVNRSCV